MKILKLKSILFSLMAITMITVFLTSCEKDKVEQETPTYAQNETKQEALLLMPLGFDDLSKELQIEYFENSTKEDLEKLSENHRIGSYLKSIGQLENVTNTLMTNGLLFTDVDLSEILTDTQLSEMVSYQYDEIQLRDICGGWSFYYSYYGHCWYPPNCCVWDVRKRTCIGWFTKYTEYVHINECT